MQAILDGLKNIGESFRFLLESFVAFVEWLPTILDTIISFVQFIPSFFYFTGAVIGLIYLVKGIIGGDTN